MQEMKLCQGEVYPHERFPLLVFQRFICSACTQHLQNVLLARTVSQSLDKGSLEASRKTKENLRRNMRQIKLNRAFRPNVWIIVTRMQHYPHQLSGGQQQRRGNRGALAFKAGILCLMSDSALDPESYGEV